MCGAGQRRYAWRTLAQVVFTHMLDEWISSAIFATCTQRERYQELRERRVTAILFGLRLYLVRNVFSDRLEAQQPMAL